MYERGEPSAVVVPGVSRTHVPLVRHTPCSFSEADPCVLILRVAYDAWQLLAKKVGY